MWHHCFCPNTDFILILIHATKPQLVKEALSELELPYLQVGPYVMQLAIHVMRPRVAWYPWVLRAQRRPRAADSRARALARRQVTASRGSPKRQQLLEKRGTFQVTSRLRGRGGGRGGHSCVGAAARLPRAVPAPRATPAHPLNTVTPEVPYLEDPNPQAPHTVHWHSKTFHKRARLTTLVPSTPPPPLPQVPYLEDPNQGVYLFESAAIVDYLYKTYKKA